LYGLNDNSFIWLAFYLSFKKGIYFLIICFNTIKKYGKIQEQILNTFLSWSVLFSRDNNFHVSFFLQFVEDFPERDDEKLRANGFDYGKLPVEAKVRIFKVLKFT